MSFDVSKLYKLSQPANGTLPRHWGYSTTDSLATIDTIGYANDAYDKLAAGDWLHVTVFDNDTAARAPTAAGIFIVRSNARVRVAQAGPVGFGLSGDVNLFNVTAVNTSIDSD